MGKLHGQVSSLTIYQFQILISILGDEKGDAMPIPDEFRGIKFHAWLDIFLEYALTLARESKIQAAYEIILSASSANVFYHSPPCDFLIHVCWFSKLLLHNNE
jgi:hypothetical protein